MGMEDAIAEVRRAEEADARRRTKDADTTLRDYFAGQALSGMLANHEWLMAVREVEPNGDKAATVIAHAAFTYADAMLKNGNKEAA